MTQVGLFKMERRFNLSIDAGEEGLRNLPMYNTYKIDIYKGIDNRFELSIRNNDRKSVSIKEDTTVVFSLVSEDKSKKYDYTATPTKPALGLYEVVIPEFDLRSIEIGSYFGHIIVKQDGIEEPLYTTQDFYPFVDVVVHENKFNTSSQAVEISGDSFTHEVIQDEITGKFYEIFTSEPIKASKAPAHSILAELVEFVGDVVIEQCLREDPDPESWTELVKREYEIDEDGKKFDGLDIFVFSAVTEYVRVKWNREQGDEANLLNITYRPETMTGGAVASVNNKVGDVVLTGEDIKTISGEGTKTIAETVETIDRNFDTVNESIDGIKAVIPETATKDNLLVAASDLEEAITPLAKTADVDTAIAVSLEPYAKTTDVIVTVDDALVSYAKTADVGEEITTALTPYAKITEVENVISTSLEGYATSEEVEAAVSGALGDYAKTADVDGIVSSALEPYAKTADVETKITNALTDYATNKTVGTTITETLEPYAKTDDVTTQITTATQGLASLSAENAFSGRQNYNGNINIYKIAYVQSSGAVNAMSARYFLIPNPTLDESNERHVLEAVNVGTLNDSLQGREPANSSAVLNTESGGGTSGADYSVWEKVGDVVLDESTGIATGFSSSSYLQWKQDFIEMDMDSANTADITICHTSSFSHTPFSLFSVEGGDVNSQLANFGYNYGSYCINDTDLSVQGAMDKRAFVRVIMANGQAKLYRFWDESGTYTLDSLPELDTSNPSGGWVAGNSYVTAEEIGIGRMRIGQHSEDVNKYVDGTIDLKNSKIVIGGVTLWNGSQGSTPAVVVHTEGIHQQSALPVSGKPWLIRRFECGGHVFLEVDGIFTGVVSTGNIINIPFGSYSVKGTLYSVQAILQGNGSTTVNYSDFNNGSLVLQTSLAEGENYSVSLHLLVEQN